MLRSCTVAGWLAGCWDYLASLWDGCECAPVWAFCGTVLWDWNEDWPFPALWSLPSFPHLLAYWVCSTLTASSFRIWNSPAGIQSPPPALFVMMLPKAQLTWHSRISDSRWVITLLWLSASLRSFLYSSSVHSYHLFLISSASVRSMPFLSFIEPILAWNIPLVSLILLKRSLVFPILLFPSIFLHCSPWFLEHAINRTTEKLQPAPL